MADRSGQTYPICGVCVCVNRAGQQDGGRREGAWHNLSLWTEGLPITRGIQVTSANKEVLSPLQTLPNKFMGLNTQVLG